MDETDFNVYFFKYIVDLQGNYICTIKISFRFGLRFVSSTTVPNISYFTFCMLHTSQIRSFKIV